MNLGSGGISPGFPIRPREGDSSLILPSTAEWDFRDAIYGLHGKDLKDELSCRYKGPIYLKSQFFTWIKRKVVLNRMGVPREAKYHYDCYKN